MTTNQSQQPSPSPVRVSISKALQKLYTQQLLTIQVFMVTAVVMFCIMLFGSFRKRTNNSFFRICLWATVVSTPLFVSYCVALMSFESGKEQSKLFPIWGILLLTGLASFGTMSAFELEDNETAVVAYGQGFLKCSFVFGLLMAYNGVKMSLYFGVALHILVPLMMIRLYDRALSLAYASKANLSIGVGSLVQNVVEFMEWDVQKTLHTEEAVDDPKTMTGYRYLVGMKSLIKRGFSGLPPFYHRNFDKEKENLVTTEDIWQNEGELSFLKGGDLKDVCLSFALFWRLLPQYIGYPLSEATSQKEKTWNFVRYGLTPNTTPDTCERAFRVIEQELSFLYDYFYTKNLVIYLVGTWWIFWHFLLMLAFLFISQFILKSHKDTLPLVNPDHILPTNVDIRITQLVVYTMVIFELVFVFKYLIITPWSRVEWVCTYVRKQLWKSQTRKDICLRWAIEHICRLSLPRNFKHWKREIGQYSLLLSHDHISPLHYLRFIVPKGLFDIQTKGRMESKSIPFSINLKQAVLSSLHRNGRQLGNGIFSLRKYRVEMEFSWACYPETCTHTILVWHIATSICEQSYLNQHSNLKLDSLSVAASLSKYCAYLVAFTPELLPDQTNTTFNIINHVILEANAMFKECHSMEAKYQKMRDMTDLCQDAKDPILNKGIWLGKSLENGMSTESLWEMLEEFWAEQLLYLAPSGDAAAHIKHLAKGGELITHLWALLTHAGILNRPRLS